MFGEDQHFTPMDVSSDKGLSEAFRISGKILTELSIVFEILYRSFFKLKKKWS